MLHIGSTVQPKAGGKPMEIVAIAPDGGVACKLLHELEKEPRVYAKDDLVHLNVRPMWVRF